MLSFLYRSRHDPEESREQFVTLSLIAGGVVALADKYESRNDAQAVGYRAGVERLYSYLQFDPEEDRGLAPGRWMGDLFREDIENGTDNHAALMADTDVLAKLVVRPAIWSLWCDYYAWPEWYDVVERIHSMRGLTHGDAAHAVNEVQNDPEYNVHTLLASHLHPPGQDVSCMDAFRLVLGIREMCKEESCNRDLRVPADWLEAELKKGLT